MVSRRKSWTTGEDTVRLWEGLLDPCLRTRVATAAAAGQKRLTNFWVGCVVCRVE